jgi:hypothetical protein
MHIRHMRLAFCTRISDRAMQLVAQHIGQRLLSINIEGGGRSRVTEQGMQVLFANCNKLQSVNLNGPSPFSLSFSSSASSRSDCGAVHAGGYADVALIVTSRLFLFLCYCLAFQAVTS